MRHTNAISIKSVNCPNRRSEGIWITYLVASDPPTHSAILFTTRHVSDPLTATRRGSSPTYPEWSGDLLPHRRTLLGGVRHIQIGYTFPTSRPTTRVCIALQKGCYRFFEQTSCGIFDLVSCCLSLFIGRAGLAAISLQDLCRIGERKGCVGSLGNSWLS